MSRLRDAWYRRKYTCKFGSFTISFGISLRYNIEEALAGYIILLYLLLKLALKLIVRYFSYRIRDNNNYYYNYYKTLHMNRRNGEKSIFTDFDFIIILH